MEKNSSGMGPSKKNLKNDMKWGSQKKNKS
jgi:hypothetical protein